MPNLIIDPSDLDHSIENMEQFIQEILERNENSEKRRLFEEFHRFSKLLQSIPNQLHSKQPKNIGNEPLDLTTKSNAKSYQDIPNEIWFKIINVMPTKDVFGNFAKVNKHFHTLTLDPASTKYMQLENVKCNGNLKLSGVLAILRRSKMLIELVLEDCSANFSDLFVEEALKSSQKLTSVTIRHSNDRKSFAISSLSLEIVGLMKRPESQIKNLEFDGVFVSEVCTIEISKIKTLRSLTSRNNYKSILSPKVIKALAENDNQLEEFEFAEPVIDKLKTQFALNKLLENKGQHLKLLCLNLDDPYHCSSSCLRLTNLSLCQTLEEFWGNLHSHDLEFISKIPKLKKLHLYNTTKGVVEMKKLFRVLDLSELQHLSFECIEGLGEDFFCEMAKREFPALNHLFINLEARLCSTVITEKTLEQLIENSAKLGTIQFGDIFASKITNKFLFDICKTRNICVIFENVLRQISLEGYFEHDVGIYELYQRMKRQSLTNSVSHIENVDVNDYF